MNNVFLSSIWNQSEKALRSADHIVFCGYSFPDADIHIKYLLKRAQTNRMTLPDYTVINHFQDKLESVSKEEEYRYKRFHGSSVKYTHQSFEEFANDPFGALPR